jgi:hypothetical protein
MPVSTETIAVAIATPADGPSFGVAPSGTWHVDVALVEHRRLDAEHRLGPRRAHARRTSPPAIDSFITSPSLPVCVMLALAGHHDRLDGQQLAADLGPGQARDDADLVLSSASP